MEQAASLETLSGIQSKVREVFVHETIIGYIVDIVRATRESPLLSLGSSPRGSLHVMRGAQALAAMKGMGFVRPDDVKEAVPIVLGHRVLVRSDVRQRAGKSAVEAMESVIGDIVATVPVPTVPDR